MHLTDDGPVIGYAEWNEATDNGQVVCGLWLDDDELCGRVAPDICDSGGLALCIQHCPCGCHP